MSSSESDDFYSDPVKQLAKFNEIESDDEDDLEEDEISTPTSIKTPKIRTKQTPERNVHRIVKTSTNNNLKSNNEDDLEEKQTPKQKTRTVKNSINNNLVIARRSLRIKRKGQTSINDDDEIIEIPLVKPQRISRSTSSSRRRTPKTRVQKNIPKTRRGRKSKNTSIVILSDDEDSAMTTEQIVTDVNLEHKIKIWWQCTEIKDFYIRKYQKIKPIFDFYSERDQIPFNRLIFLLNNKRIHPTDTPDSLNLDQIHIIEGGCVDEDLEVGENNATNGNNPLMISLKLQLRDRKKPLHVFIKKTDPLSILMAKCSEELECEIKKLKFKFDGDLLNPKETPEALDFDGGECIDVFVI